jgi:hypothetical protein
MAMPTPTFGMELKIVGNQLILSGPVVGDESGKVREALASSPGIETVILRNSGGGNAPAGYQVGQLLRERGLRTAVSGYCYSSCSRMFLGGSTRYFTDDYLPEQNNIGFHGHYDRMGRLNANLAHLRRRCPPPRARTLFAGGSDHLRRDPSRPTKTTTAGHHHAAQRCFHLNRIFNVYTS